MTFTGNVLPGVSKVAWQGFKVKYKIGLLGESSQLKILTNYLMQCQNFE